MYVRPTSTRLLRGMLIPAMRAMSLLALTLLVPRVLADHEDRAVAADDLALLAHRLDRRSYLHDPFRLACPSAPPLAAARGGRYRSRTCAYVGAQTKYDSRRVARALGRRKPRCDRAFSGVFQADDRAGARHLDDHARLAAGRAQDRHLGLLGVDRARRADQRAEARGVHERRPAEVEHDLAAAVVQGSVDRLVELRRRADVELAAQLEMRGSLRMAAADLHTAALPVTRWIPRRCPRARASGFAAHP